MTIYYQPLAWSIITLVIALMLIYVSWRNYNYKKNKMWLFYFLGFLSFLIASLLQVLFAIGDNDPVSSALYSFLVAELVLFLSLGSAQQLSERWLKYYYYYSIIATVILILGIILSSPFGISSNGIPMNFPPLVPATSSVITIPATGLILFLAARALLFKGNKTKLTSVILGVVVLGFGGMLVASGFWQVLYISEFIGMSLFLYGII
ncbi:hypothetical protein SJAV_25390 [Sulfurisphaera javensis]|uniref:Uncharacterized protein n=2 Tax=Sulfurisphaera javensis TaxID=2049879 RepID=A0AAT9GUI6_9CREN